MGSGDGSSLDGGSRGWGGRAPMPTTSPHYPYTLIPSPPRLLLLDPTTLDGLLLIQKK